MKARKKGEKEWKEYKEVFGPYGEFVGLETAGYTKSVEQIMEELNIDPEKDPFTKSRIQPEYVSRVLPLECFDLWSRDDDAAERLAEEFSNRDNGQLIYVNPWDEFRREAAKAAMQGLLTKNGYSLQPIDEPIAYGNFKANKPILDKKAREFAYSAVVYADALIDALMQERKKEQTPIPTTEEPKSTDGNFKVGDKVLITCKRKRDANYIYDGKVGEVIHIWDLERNPWGNISVMLPDGCNNGFLAEELEVIE